MKVSELIEALRGSSQDAEVVLCLKVPDGDYLLFSECPSSFAEPYPGDGGRFLVHTTVTLAELASQACSPSIIREFARALEREADSMEREDSGCDEVYDIR